MSFQKQRQCAPLPEMMIEYETPGSDPFPSQTPPTKMAAKKQHIFKLFLFSGINNLGVATANYL